MPRWFGHMDEERMAKVMNFDVEGNRCKGRVSQRSWMDGVRRALRGRGMSLEQSRLNALDRRWELIVRS